MPNTPARSCSVANTRAGAATLDLADGALAGARCRDDILERPAPHDPDRAEVAPRSSTATSVNDKFTLVQRLYDGRVRGSTTPWWTVEAPPDEPAAPLTGTIAADVAVVGGGFTGLWAARALQERGASVVVLEAETCGSGASARNGGFLHGYWSSLERLRELLGAEGALETARAADGAIAAVRSLGEDVWLTEGGLVLASTSPEHDRQVRRAIATAEALGVPEEAVPIQLGPRLRSPAFREAVFYRDGATVQPARLVRALRRGVHLYEHTPVTGIEPGRVRTAQGSVRADEVVVATNAWAARWPASRSLAVFRSAIVLTEPVPDLAERIGWENGEAVFDGRTFLHYFRPTRDGRVLMGSASGSITRAEQALRTLLPALADVRVEQRWEGPIDVSSDRFPFFGTVPGTRVHYGAGYTGNGVGPSWLGGQVLASLATGADDRWARLPLVTRTVPRLPPEPLRSLGQALVSRALLAIDDAEAAGRRPAVAARAVAAAPRLLGLRIASR
jgi:glycine/D-amino acid oxidase-like deaminating enzyme